MKFKFDRQLWMLTLLTICLVLLIYSLWRPKLREMVHPIIDSEMWEIQNPETGKPILRLMAFYSQKEKKYYLSPFLIIKDTDGKFWTIYPGTQNPDTWFAGQEEKDGKTKEFKFKLIYKGRGEPEWKW
jgi:hypothetical protein